MSDYIKREDAISLLEEICNKCSCIRGGEWCDICSTGLLISELRNKPAADVAPVKHGEWKPHKTKTGKNWWECSVCGFVSEHKRNHNYCPNCGAKMDGEGKQ